LHFLTYRYPHANYVPAKQAGDLIFTARQPSHGFNGKVGADLDEETGKAATRSLQDDSSLK